MTFSLFTGHPLEVAHVGGVEGGADDGEIVDLRRLTVALVVFYEKLQILHILVLDVAQQNGLSLQLTGIQAERSKR